MASKIVIPDGVLEKHLAILGKTGSGKTYTAKGLVERLLRDERHVCILDPTGVWWGLRTLANNKAGFPVTIFGGDHADVQIDGRSGASVANVVYTQGVSAVIDTLGLGVGERTRFARDFMEEGFRVNREPTHLVIDECHMFMPESGQGSRDAEKNDLLHAANTLVSGGRARGWRIMMVSQRPAKVHKDSLTQCETIVAHRVVAPQDRAAIEKWIQACGDAGKAREVMDTLSKLDTGEAWVSAPEEDLLKRAKMPRIKTADTSATPKAGERRIAQTVAEIDLGAIQGMLAKAGEEIEASDPAKLKARVAELKAQLAAAMRAPVEQPADVDSIVAQAKAEARKAFAPAIGQIKTSIGDIEERLGTLRAALDAIATLMSVPPRAELSPSPVQPDSSAPTCQLVDIGPAQREHGLKPSHIKALRAFLWYELLGVAEPTDGQLAFWLGYSPKSSTISALLSALRKAGMVDGRRITEQARGLVEPPQIGTLRDFHASIRQVVPGGSRKIFDFLVERHPQEVTAREVCDHCGWTTTSSTLSAAASALRKIGVIERRGLRLTAIVFPAGVPA